MKNDNPAMRLRSECQLGPRTQVKVRKEHSSELLMPKVCFVELSTFLKDYPDRAVPDNELIWEQINGQWVRGVS